MTDLFNVWNPHLLTSTTLIFDITPAEAALVRNGTTSFVSGCLRAFGLVPNPFHWTIKPARQSYYSDYLHSPDWRARWDIVWIFEVTFSSPVELREPVRAIPYKTGVSDESAEACDEPTIGFGEALLLASFARRENVELEVSETVLNWKAEKGITADFPLTLLPHVGGRLLVRGLIDFRKFPDDIDDLELLHAKWRRIGGLTNWHDVPENI
jgi:hypothetical protein